VGGCLTVLSGVCACNERLRAPKTADGADSQPFAPTGGHGAIETSGPLNAAPLLLNAGSLYDPDPPRSRNSSQSSTRAAPAGQFSVAPLGRPDGGLDGGLDDNSPTSRVVEMRRGADVSDAAIFGNALVIDGTIGAQVTGSGGRRAPSSMSRAFSSAASHARRRKPWHCYCWLNLCLLTTLIAAIGATALHISTRVGSYSMFHDELAGKWLVDAGIDAPVWVGEFGVGGDYDDTVHEGAGGTYWKYMLRFLRQYELDYAYWPINGDAWVNATQEWDNEDYGILDRDYVNVRRPGQLAGLQKLTW